MSKGTQKKRKQFKPSVFIISGPSGVGKTTLLDKLFSAEAIEKNFTLGISFTTRAMRPKEKEGVDYFFVEKLEFLILERGRFFLESQKVFQDHYGTPKFFYKYAKKIKKHLILCIDVKGEMHLKKKLKTGKIISIFISAPTEKELCRRLKKRAEGSTIAQERIRLAKKEMSYSSRYNHTLVNKDFKSCLKKLQKLLLQYL